MEEDMRVLAEGIAQLNEKEQKTLALHYMEGLKMEQVGRVIGVSQPEHPRSTRSPCVSCAIYRNKKWKGDKVRCIRDFIIWRQAC